MQVELTCWTDGSDMSVVRREQGEAMDALIGMIRPGGGVGRAVPKALRWSESPQRA
jgi:hypothetical protein